MRQIYCDAASSYKQLDVIISFIKQWKIGELLFNALGHVLMVLIALCDIGGFRD